MGTKQNTIVMAKTKDKDDINISKVSTHISIQSTLSDKNSHVFTIFPDWDEFLGRQWCL